MSKRSIVTAREAPVEKAVSAAGGLVIHGDTFAIETEDRVQLIDLTDRVMAHVRKSGVKEGMISLWSMHTTCTLFINESQKALEADIKKFVKDRIAPYKYPRWIEFVGELPKTATGKIQRFKLRQ